MCRNEGMGIAPWGALGGGRFKSEEQRKAQDGRAVELRENDAKVSNALETIAKRKGSIMTSVALAYVMHKAPYVFPIVGGRKLDHIKGNIDALSLELSKEEIQEIDGAAPFDLGFPHSMLWGNEVPESLGDIKFLAIAGNYEHVPETQVG
jgi:aryl-alcohol dehydrogenase-like predicted oxidoreductase